LDECGRSLEGPAWVTRVTDRMEEAGLVQRVRPPDDRRVILVSMTPTGQGAREAAPAHRRGIEEHFVRHLNDRDLAGLERMFRKVSEHVRRCDRARVSG
jgi:DNA-binding MarR family transcriptional regulator